MGSISQSREVLGSLGEGNGSREVYDMGSLWQSRAFDRKSRAVYGSV